MSESREQSYYEIALTNRQVMGVFVVLLVCVLAAFIGGVWVGRGGSTSVATVEPEAISAGRPAGEEPLKELDFFSSEGAAGAARTAGTQAEAEGAPPEDSAQPIIIEEIGRRGEATQTTVAGDGDLPFPLDAAGDTAQPAAAEESGPTSAAPALDNGEVVVQIFSSNDEAQAKRVMERVRSGGYPSEISPVDVDGRPMYRVRVGPYRDRAEAQRVADVIRRTYKLDTWITR